MTETHSTVGAKDTEECSTTVVEFSYTVIQRICYVTSTCYQLQSTPNSGTWTLDLGPSLPLVSVALSYENCEALSKKVKNIA